MDWSALANLSPASDAVKPNPAALQREGYGKCGTSVSNSRASDGPGAALPTNGGAAYSVTER